MPNGDLNWISGFIWNIADDVLRDVYVRGKYRDVILPVTVIRRIDAVLEPSKEAVLRLSKQLDDAGVANKQAALYQASGNAFYNISPFTLRDLRARAKQQQLKADFEAFLDGFSPNVQEILDKFKFRNQIPTLVETDILGSLIEKFTTDDINLSPDPVFDQDGNIRLPGLDNHAMGTIFEELIRRFNEENNEEAGEHFTPRDVIRLMANLIFFPIADDIRDATYRVYDGACGTGGMLTIAEETLQQLAKEHGKNVSIHLFGQEINPETYAISKADLLLKGEGQGAENMKFGSTLSSDAYPSMEFDFMLSNPPYGKSWKIDLERIGGKKDLADPRFTVLYQGEELSLITRADDGQLMFLVNKLTKMNHNTLLGSRIAEVHNGSSLFTGDAGQGESNIRRWIIGNDWLEAIIALPLNMFYNTDIATYIWVLSNRKSEKRKGKVQLIDATKLSTPLRRNLGKKNCQLSIEQIKKITDIFLAFEENDLSRIIANESFGYYKITVERPLRLKLILSKDRLSQFLRSCQESDDKELAKVIQSLSNKIGEGPHMNFNRVLHAIDLGCKSHSIYLTAGHKKLIRNSLTLVDEKAAPVIKKIHNHYSIEPDPIHGFFKAKIRGKELIIEYEPDPVLRDTEQVGLSEKGGILDFFQREVLPVAPDSWIAEKVKIGYDIHVERHFRHYNQLRDSRIIAADVAEAQRNTEKLFRKIMAFAE